MTEAKTEMFLVVEQADGSKYAVPVSIIARNRATWYAAEFDGNVDQSLAEDTMPLFEQDHYAIEDWAANNMNWSAVSAHAVKIGDGDSDIDFQEAWVNGEKEVVRMVPPSKEPVTGAPAMPTDTEIIDWLERQHTLHRRVEALYVVEGYLVSINYDGEPIPGKEWHGETLREAYAEAMKHWDTTHGNVDLLAQRSN